MGPLELNLISKAMIKKIGNPTIKIIDEKNKSKIVLKIL
ncbi:hypothetical protein EU95_0576 [Prochlorococcus marinus str. MIT 9201]|uniref:Uncharacterized protein n=1 Tax=Prochlorococcus marinus str. MIT 9201 TaxID=93057 RepID=A0A0A2A797_PROMR|nr:hypothetical protein EU95_0576 [Prochlorococcus marinus str. MIT 9201]